MSMFMTQYSDFTANLECVDVVFMNEHAHYLLGVDANEFAQNRDIRCKVEQRLKTLQADNNRFLDMNIFSYISERDGLKRFGGYNTALYDI